MKLTHDFQLLTRYFAEVNTVSSETFRIISDIVCDSLSNAKEQPSVLVSALRLIERETLIDQEMERRKTYSGYIPPGRPKGWRDSILELLKVSND